LIAVAACLRFGPGVVGLCFRPAILDFSCSHFLQRLALYPLLVVDAWRLM